VNVLAKFMAWVKNDPMKIFWLAGMAGTGKTSIAVTLCRMLEDDADVVLGGTFFCSRSAGSIARTEVRRILPTLSACLAGLYPEFGSALLGELTVHNRAMYRPVSDQIGPLLVRPLVQLPRRPLPIVFVIDALDECSDERELSQLLAVIADLTCDMAVKFILTSRPEMHIRGTPIANPELNTILQLHTISEDEVISDIRLYITSTLRAAAPNAKWFTNEDIGSLTQLSHGLFIFAATALRYVLDQDNDDDRAERLGKATSVATKRTAATTTMDKMYELVLTEASRDDKVDDDELDNMKQILACILTARTSLSVQALAELTEQKPTRLRGTLKRLHSLVYLPQSDSEPGLRTLHASLGDYLFQRSSAHLRIPGSLGHDALSRGCLRRMRWDDLCFNVSQSRSSYTQNNKKQSHGNALALIYACLHWAHHIDAASDHVIFDAEIERIFWPKFLFWLEMLSSVGKVGLASGLLRIAASAVSTLTSDHDGSLIISQVRQDRVLRFLRDANTFVVSSHEAIERSAPHIYLSALPFTAKDSLIYETFSPFCTGLVSVETVGIDRHGGRLITTLTGHEGAVTSLTYAPDGRTIASGSNDGTLRVWNVRTGEETTPPLISGDGKVISVAFAPDGKIVASGNETGNIYIWSLSGSLLAPQQLPGHTEAVKSLEFSPDGSLLASASFDKSVRMWTIVNGQEFARFSDHTGPVNTVAFSPDGCMLASGSGDQTIRLRRVDTQSQEPAGETLHGHDTSITCVRFSPDGSKLISVSGEKVLLCELQTVKIIIELPSLPVWTTSVQFSPDLSSLVCVDEIRMTLSLRHMEQEGPEASPIDLYRYTDSGTIRSATFSPDGKSIATASDDGKIHIWDARSGQTALKSLPAHNYLVRSMAISSTGTIVVTGLDDCTIRVWDPQTGGPVLPPLRGHRGIVASVDISTDAMLIVSGSRDHTVRLWNAITGNAVGRPLQGHEGPVNAVAFSADTHLIASGSDDGTVRVWVVATRQLSSIGVLAYGHPVRTVVFSHDRRIVAAGDRNGSVHLWVTETGRPAREPLLVGGSVDTVVFTPDDVQVLSLAGGMIAVWDVVTGQQILSLNGDKTGFAAAHSSDIQLIGTANFSDTVTLWNIHTGTPLATLHGHGDLTDTVTSIRFSPDGRSLISYIHNKGIRLWNVKEALLLLPNSSADAAMTWESTRLRDEWLTGHSGELLLWVPVEYHPYLQLPPCTMIIGGPRVVISTDIGQLHHGENWTACWRGTPPV